MKMLITLGAVAIVACNGVVGSPGTCSVRDNGDGSATISCSDGTSAMLKGLAPHGDADASPYITVGAVGSLADYTSDDESAFNAAVASAKSGVDVFVLPGTLIKPASPLKVVNVSSSRIVFGAGAMIQLQAAQSTAPFEAIPVSGGAKASVALMVVANCTNVDIWSPTLDTLDTQNGEQTAIHVGGNVHDVTIHGERSSRFTKWGLWITGYWSDGTTTYDGPVTSFASYDHSSDGEGGPNDGGHLKISNGSTAAAPILEGIYSYRDHATNVKAIGVDLPLANFGTTSGVLARDVHVVDAHLEGQPGSQAGVHLEFNTATASAADVFVVRPWVTGFTQGYVLNAPSNEHVVLEDPIFVDGSSNGVGIAIAGGKWSGSIGSVATLDYEIRNPRLVGCAHAIRIDASGFGAGGGLSGVRIRGGGSYDDGAGVASVGVELKNSPSTHLDGVLIDGFDLDHMKAGAVAVDTSAYATATATNDAIVNCAGYNELHGVAP